MLKFYTIKVPKSNAACPSLYDLFITNHLTPKGSTCMWKGYFAKDGQTGIMWIYIYLPLHFLIAVRASLLVFLLWSSSFIWKWFKYYKIHLQVIWKSENLISKNLISTCSLSVIISSASSSTSEACWTNHFAVKYSSFLAIYALFWFQEHFWKSCSHCAWQ